MKPNHGTFVDTNIQTDPSEHPNSNPNQVQFVSYNTQPVVTNPTYIPPQQQINPIDLMNMMNMQMNVVPMSNNMMPQPIPIPNQVSTNSVNPGINVIQEEYSHPPIPVLKKQKKVKKKKKKRWSSSFDYGCDLLQFLPLAFAAGGIVIIFIAIAVEVPVFVIFGDLCFLIGFLGFCGSSNGTTRICSFVCLAFLVVHIIISLIPLILLVPLLLPVLCIPLIPLLLVIFFFSMIFVFVICGAITACCTSD